MPEVKRKPRRPLDDPNLKDLVRPPDETEMRRIVDKVSETIEFVTDQENDDYEQDAKDFITHFATEKEMLVIPIADLVEIAKIGEVIKKLMALHHERDGYCRACELKYPCPTVRLIKEKTK